MSNGNEPPVVSVLLPVRDGGATIARAVASIRAQNFTAWELIVIDDGSADETRAIVTANMVEDARVRLVAREHEGIAAALNAGIAVARGEFIARMDADDESYPERLAEQVAFLQRQENREVGLVGCLVEFGGDRAVGAGYGLHVDWINSLVTPEEIALNRFVESPFAHPSVMFRREVAEQFGGYRAGEFPEDYELWLRWLDAGVRMAKVPRALLRWNDPPARLSRTDRRYDPEAFFRVKAEWIARWLEQSKQGAEAAPRRASDGFRGSASATKGKVWVWGAGRPTRKRAAYLERHGVRIAGYIDVDPRKMTRALGGIGVPVIVPDGLPPPGEMLVLGYVASRGARALIRDALRRRGYQEGRDFLMCA